MDAQGILTKFETTYAKWRSALDASADEAFSRDPGTGDWKLGQVCDHVVSASQAFLTSATALARGKGEERGGSFMTFVFFDLIGSFPPARFKVPPKLPRKYAHFANPGVLTKSEALARFEEVAERQRSICEAVAGAAPKLRSRHPAAGWLTAKQWYRCSEMHMRHHLRQLGRIEKMLTTEPPPSG